MYILKHNQKAEFIKWCIKGEMKNTLKMFYKQSKIIFTVTKSHINKILFTDSNVDSVGFLIF